MISSADLFSEVAARIRPIDPAWVERAQKRQDSLTKPPGSLGRLEALAHQICGIVESLEPAVAPASLLVFAADHGVCAEGVNPFPQAVTRQMVLNFLHGGAAINALAASVGARLAVVDVGVLGAPIEHPQLIRKSIAQGTQNICAGPAMSDDQAARAMLAGMECAEQQIQNGAQLLGLGEMGIGNTTVASAICSALTGADAALVCGRGTGSDDAGLLRKQDAVRRAVALHAPEIAGSMDVLSRLGGFEIAALCGVCLQSAMRRRPVLVDGFISTAAAALAVAMQPAVRDFLIASHLSVEPGHRVLLDWLGLQPLLDLQMRLGEGTGAALAIPVVRAAVAAFVSMATFASAGVSSSELNA